MTIVLFCESCKYNATFLSAPGSTSTTYLFTTTKTDSAVDWLVDHITHDVYVRGDNDDDSQSIQHRLTTIRNSHASVTLDLPDAIISPSTRKVFARYALLEIDATEMMDAILTDIANRG